MTNFHPFSGIFRPRSGMSRRDSGLIEPSRQNPSIEADSVEPSGQLPSTKQMVNDLKS
jgi:hypothetical protein